MDTKECYVQKYYSLESSEALQYTADYQAGAAPVREEDWLKESQRTGELLPSGSAASNGFRSKFPTGKHAQLQEELRERQFAWPRYVILNNLIVSDEWRGYSRPEENGFVHKTVCHKTNFVNPETRYHTQAIERAWIEVKQFLKRARYPTEELQSHLDEVSWKMPRRDHPGVLFAAFIRDIGDCCDTI